MGKFGTHRFYHWRVLQHTEYLKLTFLNTFKTGFPTVDKQTEKLGILILLDIIDITSRTTPTDILVDT